MKMHSGYWTWGTAQQSPTGHSYRIRPGGDQSGPFPINTGARGQCLRGGQTQTKEMICLNLWKSLPHGALCKDTGRKAFPSFIGQGKTEEMDKPMCCLPPCLLPYKNFLLFLLASNYGWCWGTCLLQKEWPSNIKQKDSFLLTICHILYPIRPSLQPWLSSTCLLYQPPSHCYTCSIHLITHLIPSSFHSVVPLYFFNA